MCQDEPHCRFNNLVEKVALGGKFRQKSGLFKWHSIIISVKLQGVFELCQDNNRVIHENFIPLHQSLIYTTSNLMANLNRLKLVLVEKDKTGKWLSEQLGKSTCTVSKWCKNTVQPDLNTLDKIAKLLDIDVKDLLNDTEK